MSAWRDRWPDSPVARVAYFGERGPEEYPVYEAIIDGSDQFLSMIVSRYQRPQPLLVHFSHLIFLSDMNPREESVTADWRVETDGPSVFNVASGTMSPFTAQTWQALAVESGSCFRLLLSSSAIRTITPLLEGAEVMKFVNADSELWPELRHNRR